MATLPSESKKKPRSGKTKVCAEAIAQTVVGANVMISLRASVDSIIAYVSRGRKEKMQFVVVLHGL
jgi:hypothetical protein